MADGAAPQQRVFADEVNAAWRWLLHKVSTFLEPLLPALHTALPPQPPGSELQQVCLLLDMDLAPLPFEALPELQHTSLSRCFSLHMLAACLPPGSDPPVADISRMAYIVDPCHQHSTPLQLAPGPYSIPLASSFKELAADPHGKDWAGLQGQPGRTPTDSEYQQVLKDSSGLIFFGLSRLLAYLRPQAVSSLDLRGCDLALVLDRAAEPEAARRQQQQADNAKSAEALRLESPTQAAALLMLRGVRCIVLNSMATTTWANGRVLGEAVKRLAGGQVVGTAVDEVRRGLREQGYEVECAGAVVQVYGVPWMTCAVGGGRGAKPPGKR